MVGSYPTNATSVGVTVGDFSTFSNSTKSQFESDYIEGDLCSSDEYEAREASRYATCSSTAPS